MPGCKNENAEFCTVDGQFGGKYGGVTQIWWWHLSLRMLQRCACLHLPVIEKRLEDRYCFLCDHSCLHSWSHYLIITLYYTCHYDKAAVVIWLSRFKVPMSTSSQLVSSLLNLTCKQLKMSLKQLLLLLLLSQSIYSRSIMDRHRRLNTVTVHLPLWSSPVWLFSPSSYVVPVVSDADGQRGCCAATGCAWM